MSCYLIYIITLLALFPFRVLAADITISGYSELNARPSSGDLFEVVDVSDTTMSANGTNKKITATNLTKQWCYILLPAGGFKMRGSSVTDASSTQTDFNYGLPKFSNSADKANNYIDWIIVVPPDVDTAIDLTAKLQFYLGGADTGDHEYIVSMVSIAASAAAAGAPSTAVSLGYTADASGADGDYEATSETTLTDWRSNVTAGNLWRIRLERDGDHANDTSTVDSYPLVLIIKYQTAQ